MATSQSQSFKGGSISPGASIEADDLKNLVVNRKNDVDVQQQETYEPLVGKVFNIGRAHIKVNGTEIGSYDPLDTEKDIDIDVPAAQAQSDWDEADNTKPDYIKNKPDLGLKADKVQGATAGNLAALDANGNLADSGKKTADFKTKQTAVSVTGGSLKGVASMSQNANGEVTLTLNDIQDGTTAQKGVVQLNNAINSTSTTEAATPKAVKDAYDDLNNKIVARAVFLSQAEWAVQSQLPGDPAKVYYVENGTGEDAYTVYVWKESTSEYVEVDESSIDLDGYWHDGPTTTGNGNVVTNITLGNDGVPQIEKGLTALTQHQDISGKLDKTGDASNTTSTFTKASGDTSSMTSGGKLSALFTAISSFFASVASALGGKADKANITGATKCKITYNGQGIVTSGADLSASDIPNLAASKITSGTFGTDRIADDAITADKVKDNETLPVNISGRADQADTVKSNGLSTGILRLALIPDNNVGYKSVYTLPHCWMHYSPNEGLTLTIGNNGGAVTSDRRGSFGVGNGAYIGYIRSANLTRDRDFQLPNAGGTLALQNGSYPSMKVGNLTPSGNPGQVLMSNGSGTDPSWADIASAQTKHSNRITVGAGVVPYSTSTDNFSIGINYDKANSRAFISVTNSTVGRQLYVSLGHSSSLTPVAYHDTPTITATTSEYYLGDLDILCMGTGDDMPVYSFTIAIQVNENFCQYTVYDKMMYHV